MRADALPRTVAELWPSVEQKIIEAGPIWDTEPLERAIQAALLQAYTRGFIAAGGGQKCD